VPRENYMKTKIEAGVKAFKKYWFGLTD
jgi:hypothetical protein